MRPGWAAVTGALALALTSSALAQDEEQVVVYRLQHAEARLVAETLDRLFVPIRVTFNQPDNAVLVAGARPVLDDVAALIAQLDVPGEPLLVEFTVVEAQDGQQHVSSGRVLVLANSEFVWLVGTTLPRPGPAAPAAARRPSRAIVLAPDAALRDRVREVLEGVELEVWDAGTMAEAAATAEQHPPGLVIVADAPPQFDATQVIADLAALADPPPAVLVLATDTTAERLEALAAAGADGVLPLLEGPEPLNRPELAELARRLLAQRGAPEGDQMMLDGVRVESRCRPNADGAYQLHYDVLASRIADPDRGLVLERAAAGRCRVRPGEEAVIATFDREGPALDSVSVAVTVSPAP